MGTLGTLGTLGDAGGSRIEIQEGPEAAWQKRAYWAGCEQQLRRGREGDGRASASPPISNAFLRVDLASRPALCRHL